MSNNYSPIVIFTFLRFQKLKRLINTLKKSEISKHSEIYFFSDFAKTKYEINKIKKIRIYLKKVTGFKKKTIILRKNNFGNGKNIINGIDYVFKKHTKAIILEDDLEIGKNFLFFMNLCLKKYEYKKKIWHISGWNFNMRPKDNKFDVFFSRNMNCWGWGTWRNRWKYFEKKPENVLIEAKKIKTEIISFVGFTGGYAKKNSNISVHSKVDNYGISEDTAHIFMHIIVQFLKQKNVNKKIKKIKF